MKNCWNCKHALEARDHVREGEQVRCGFAEKEFGGTRWVNVRKSEKTGKYLQAKCGQFQPFIGDDSTAQEVVEEETPKVKVVCKRCKGSGRLRVQFLNSVEHMKCHGCEGKGNILA